MTPRCLSEIIGQPFPIARLQALVRQPHESCWLIESPEPGVGKTATAHCVAYELGCDDAMSGLFFVPVTRLTLDKATELLEYTLHHRPLMGRGWKVLILDELERLPSVQVANYLKSALDEYSLPPKTIVVATSNGAGNLEPALLQRFELLAYSSGAAFQAACLERIAELWQAETGDVDLPTSWRHWGSARGEFSMRLAMRAFQEALRNRQEIVSA